MNKDEIHVLQQKITALQSTLEEYRLYADFSLAVQMILHNIRNSISGAVGSSEVINMVVDDLLKNVDQLTTEQLKAELNQIKSFSELAIKSNKKIGILTKEILVKGKAEKSVSVERFDLNAVIKNEISFLKYTAPFIDSTIQIDAKLSKVPIFISVKKHDIVQVFENLAHNAIESMQGGGTMTIETTFDDEFVYFSLSDTGPGIDDECLAKIFEPFFTTKVSTDKLTFFGGTGLGLHSCERLIDAYDGTITVEGDLDPGARFTVKLPIG